VKKIRTNNIKVRKLELHKQTIIDLATDDLTKVAGGARSGVSCYGGCWTLPGG
jgi:hypothetical protein